MNLYLMRHANAGVPRENPILDAKRALIKEGKQQCMLMAGILAASGAQIDVIISSPLKRAKQTAQFVATEIGCEAPLIASPALAPDGDFAAFQQLIHQFANNEGVLVVGHNPNLSQFLGKLVTGNGPGSIRMRKAGIARVDMERRPAQLQWILDPRLARAVYTSVVKSSRPKTSRK